VQSLSGSDRHWLKTLLISRTEGSVATKGCKDSITITLHKDNRYKAYVLELEHIKYSYLDEKIGLDPLQRQFWEKREELIKQNIKNYLNTTNDTIWTNKVDPPNDTRPYKS
jgi:hypothetical protein